MCTFEGPIRGQLRLTRSETLRAWTEKASESQMQKR